LQLRPDPGRLCGVGRQQHERVVPRLTGGGKIAFRLKRSCFGGQLVELIAIDQGVALGAGQDAERQSGTAVGAFVWLRRNQFGQPAFRRFFFRLKIEDGSLNIVGPRYHKPLGCRDVPGETHTYPQNDQTEEP
jgi:hypothetical protein